MKISVPNGENVLKKCADKTIAFYIGSLAKGGAERVITNLAEFYCQNGYKVYMVTKMLEENEYSISQEITRIIADITPDEETNSRAKNLYLRIHKLRKIWKDIKPNAIVSFIGKNNLMSIASSRGMRIPVYVSVRSAPQREIGMGLSKYLTFFLFSMAKGIILQTTEAKNFFPSFLHKKIMILPNSVNPKFIKPLYQGEREPVIVSVGRLDDNKNQQILIEAFDILKDEFPDWRLEFYGDGENYNKLSEMIDAKNLTQRIKLMGSRPDIDIQIQKASIFVLTSKVEGMPNALIEAMALGLAVISTDCPCGGPADLIQNKVNGILVPVDDLDALCSSLREVLSNESYRKELSVKAHNIIDTMNPDKVNQLWMECISH